MAIREGLLSETIHHRYLVFWLKYFDEYIAWLWCRATDATRNDRLVHILIYLRLITSAGYNEEVTFLVLRSIVVGIRNHSWFHFRGFLDLKWFYCVTGEVGAGKSTFLNLLIGSKILPSSLLACTSVICLLRNSDRKGYSVMETGSGQQADTWFDEDASPDQLHAKLQDIICKKDRNLSNCCQVDIHWPIPILKVC